MSGEDDDGFLSRWSRRKRRGGEGPGAESPVHDAEAAPDAPASEAEDEGAVLERLGLPDPDSLQPGDDFSAFMRSAVPQAIRNRALRRLWRSNPTLAVLDGLNDYDGDFSGGFVKPGMLQTAYRVGRGFLEEPDRTEADKEVPPDDGREEPAPPASSLRTPGELDRPEPGEHGGGLEAENADAADGAPETQEPETGPTEPTRRRMAFRFPDEA